MTPKSEVILFKAKTIYKGEYRFTVYIENRYLRIDICIELNVSISKKISIIHVNGQKMFIYTENPSASSKIAIILRKFQPKCTIYYRFLCFDHAI